MAAAGRGGRTAELLETRRQGTKKYKSTIMKVRKTVSFSGGGKKGGGETQVKGDRSDEECTGQGEVREGGGGKGREYREEEEVTEGEK